MEPTGPAITCPSCRHANDAGASFCSRCGAALTAATQGGASPSGWDLATAGMHQPAAPMDPTRLAKEDYAGWWQRLGGSILDGIIFLIPLVVVVGIIIGIAYSMDSSLLEDFGADPTYSDPYGYDSTSPGEDAWILGALGAYVLYLLAWDVLWIRSRHMGRPGQILAGYRVVRLEGTQRLGLGRASARAAAKLCYNVPSLGPLASLTSAFTIGLTEHKQGLHDLISGTVCVRTSALERRGLIGDGDGAAAMTAPTWSPVTGGPVPPAPPAPPRPSDSGPFV